MKKKMSRVNRKYNKLLKENYFLRVMINNQFLINVLKIFKTDLQVVFGSQQILKK